MKDAAGLFMRRTHEEIQGRGMLVFLSLGCLTRPAPASQGHLSNCDINHGPSRSHKPCLSMLQPLKTEYGHNSGFGDLPQIEMDSSGTMFGSRFRLLSDWNEVFIQLCVMDAEVRVFGGQSPQGSPQSSGGLCPQVSMPLSRTVEEGGREKMLESSPDKGT